MSARPRADPQHDARAVLYPAVAEAARRVGADRIGLIDLGADGPHLALDAVGLRYSTGQWLGDEKAADQLEARVVGPGLIPATPLPPIGRRIALDGNVAALPDALAAVPAGDAPVVLTAWSLSRLAPEDRLRLLQHLTDAATHRAATWVSVEGVGVAPAVPTFGDRRASGHSIIGLTVVEHASLHADGLGRCWSRGRHLSWLAPAQEPWIEKIRPG